MCIYSTNSTDGSYHRAETWNWLGARRLHRHIYMYYFCQLQVNCKLSFMHQQYRIMNNQLMAHNTAENLDRAGLCCTLVLEHVCLGAYVFASPMHCVIVSLVGLQGNAFDLCAQSSTVSSTARALLFRRCLML